MSDKISPVAVARQAVALSWKRKWAFAGLLLAGSVAPLLGMCLPVLGGSLAGPLMVLAFCIHILAMLFLTTTTNHLAVTEQRGIGTAIPRPFWPAMGRVFIRVLIICLIFFGVMLVVMVPFGTLVYSISPDPTRPDGSGSPATLAIILAGAVLYFLIIGFLLRLGIMIPGASVGHVVGVREALAMTRGHAWRIFWSLMLVSVPVAILGFIFQAIIAAGMSDGNLGAAEVVPFILLLVLDLFAWIVMIVTNAVWYEKLRLRMAGPESGQAFEFAPATESSAAPHVGPYVDLPTK